VIPHEEQVTCLLGHGVMCLLFLGELGNGKERMPTMDMKRKNRMTETASGTPSHMVVFPSKRASKVTAKQRIRMTRLMITRSQKKRFSVPVRGSSLDVMDLPESLAKIMWNR
jgi:hypothetical protein